MCVVVDDNNKLRFDKAETWKLAIQLITITSLIFALHYNAIGDLNLKIKTNENNIQAVRETLARHETAIEKNQERIIELLKHGN